jgi:protein-disulfide isomerase
MQSEKVQRKVRTDFWSGIRSGVNGTPTFFINGHRHNGTYFYGELRIAIQQAARERAGV